ncbi:methyl-accepting chemotaxis protein [Arenibaculum pallidiluteum]|uniref:methyl-accepting chemotaxis protein n=1 Tax=Arenibaculum pallidiluteum TaxID=2812559 RepID=UPI001A960146|nr:HAMP domain-containing methyl-accepting chemotaxis protein [Arenibaculum pallidiluteum]
MSIAKLDLGRRLFLAYALFLLPVAYLLYSLVAQQNIAIDFALKERQGNAYLTALREAQTALHARLRTGDAAGATGIVPALRAAEAAHGQGMDSAALSAELAGKVAALGGRPSAEAGEAALAALRALVVRVGDKSNLILDPDLDSYYAMDIVLIKGPDLLDRIGGMATLAAALAADGALDAEERTEYLIQKGGLSALVEGIAASVDSGYRANADGSLRANLDAGYRSADQAVRRLMETLDRGLLAGSGRVALEPGAVAGAEAEAMLASASFLATTSRELDRLLDIRTGGFRMGQVKVLAVTAVLFVLALGVIVLMVSRGVSLPIRRMTSAMEALSRGDLGVEIPGAGRGDEVGVMARAVEVFRTGLVEARRLGEEQAASHAREASRAKVLAQLTQEFDSAVSRVMSTVDTAAHQVQDVSSALSSAATRAVQQSSTVAASAQQASANVETVAAATEELSASIREIQFQISDAGRVSREGVEAVDGADRTISGLAEAAGRIGDVVSLINDIAARTNLLALNATIEAARAGEAGKGFAVVANEVKHLANQTAKATEEITAQITAMQETTHQAVAAVKSVGGAMLKVDQVMGVIAGAAEQQTAATLEIARNAQEAAIGNAEVTREIAGVSDDAAASGETTGALVRSADGLIGATQDLRGTVQTFLSQVGAA